MDALLSAAARALAAGDVLAALNRVALRDDPSALALRGIAMARLGDLPRAGALLRDAGRRFGPREALARHRCVVAGAEVALAMRDLRGPLRPLAAAAAHLDAHGDRANAVQARLIAARHCLLVGQLEAAQAWLAQVHGPDAGLPPSVRAVAALTRAEALWRTLQVDAAEDALAQARAAAVEAGVPALLAEVAKAASALHRPAARRVDAGTATWVPLGDVATLLRSGTLVVDACRRTVQSGDTRVPLASRPVPFALAAALARAWPNDVPRNALIAEVFRTRHPDETHRARLRVALGRLRALLAPVARIDATPAGYALAAADGGPVALLLPPFDGDDAAALALLADGAPWSTSGLAQALGTSQRAVQRTLAALLAEGRVRAVGAGRARRWVGAPLAEFTTILLLPVGLAPG